MMFEGSWCWRRKRSQSFGFWEDLATGDKVGPIPLDDKGGPAFVPASAVERALRRLDEDTRQRLLVFDGGPQLMSWEQAHRHHADDPYIGCPFCHDRFVLRDAE